MEVAKLTAVVEANTSGFSRAMRGVDDDLGRTKRHLNDLDGNIGRTHKGLGGMGSTLGRVGAGFAVAGAAGAAAIGVGLVAALHVGIGELKDFQTNMANTKAGLKSTGGVANVTAKDITNLASSIEKKTGIDGDQIHAGENLLLTFTKVRNEVGKGNDVFNRATQAAVDLQQRGFGSVESASVMLGKALNDPTKGISALSRAGVTFTAAQKEQVKAMQESGNMLGAQKLIMKEVEGQVGGSAEAYGKTLPGAIDRMKRGLEGVAFTLTNALAPALTSAVDWALKNFPAVEAVVSQVLGQITPIIQTFATAIGAAFSKSGQGTSVLRTALGNLQTAFASLAPAFTTIGQMAQKIAPVLGQYLASAFTALSRIAAAVMPIMADAITKVGPPLARLTVAVLKIGAVVLQVLGTVIPPIVRALAPIFGVAFTAIGAIIDTIASLLSGDFVGAFRNAKTAVKAIFITIPSMLSGILVDAIAAVGRLAVQLGSRLIDGITSAITSGAGRIGSAISSAIKDAITSIDIPGFSPPEHAAAQAIGTPLARGVKMGFLNGTADLPEKIEGRIKAALERGKRAVERQQGALQGSFGKLGSGMMRAFDAQTQRGVAGLQRTGAALTPAEAALAAEQAAHDESQRLADKKAAEDALAKAQAEGDAQAIADAQARINELSYQDRIAALQKTADAERKARDDETAKKVLDYEAQREQQRTRYEEQIADLEKFLDRRNVSQAAKNKKLTALMNDPEMRDALDNAGLNLGKAFSTGINKSEKHVRASIKRLAKLVRDYLELNSPAKRGPLSTLDSWWTAMPNTLLSGVDTSMIGQVAAGIASPDMAGGSGGAMGQNVTVIVNVEGSVQAEADLADTIRRELIRTGQRNGSIFGGYA